MLERRRYFVVLMINRGGCGINTDYVKIPIFPRFTYDIYDFMQISQFDIVKSQLFTWSARD